MEKMSPDFPNYDIKLSHHEKRTLAWKVIGCICAFFGVMLFTGIVHYTLGLVDPVQSILIMAIGWLSIGMFGFGYLVRDRLPKRMNIKCKRFAFMGHEFGIWHWSRAQIFLADIFLVSLASAEVAWCIGHTIPLVLAGTSLTTVVWLVYIPILYAPLWVEITLELALIGVTVLAVMYELKTWILGKSGDFCFFEGVADKSERLSLDCDPADPSCYLNKNFT